MKGMNNATGRAVSDLDHLRQSVRDILTTPVGSRVMRREYGSRLFTLIDHPGNRGNLLRLASAAAHAILRWEPRLQLRRVQIQPDASGLHVVDIEAVVTTDNSPVTLSTPLSLGMSGS